MSGPGYGKKPLKIRAFLHEAGKSGARITHIDIEGPMISKIIRPGEATYCAGKQAGAFIGLKKSMLARANRLLKRKK
ncbi:hypothetical protein COS75_02940 [Candidatus Pacearchaeota archaeon CG06_land_8_20_14_3_00_35_12]|nr:MAG: hypothetical protein COS75_02940 [Candidatus Pacearchaeota archaeon CG06_land_8_20_14_3_00_35_12]